MKVNFSSLNKRIKIYRRSSTANKPNDLTYVWLDISTAVSKTPQLHIQWKCKQSLSTKEPTTPLITLLPQHLFARQQPGRHWHKAPSFQCSIADWRQTGAPSKLSNIFKSTTRFFNKIILSPSTHRKPKSRKTPPCLPVLLRPSLFSNLISNTASRFSSKFSC